MVLWTNMVTGGGATLKGILWGHKLTGSSNDMLMSNMYRLRKTWARSEYLIRAGGSTPPECDE